MVYGENVDRWEYVGYVGCGGYVYGGMWSMVEMRILLDMGIMGYL